MNVLLTSVNLMQGGSQSFLRTLARGLESLGHSVVAYGSGSETETVLESESLRTATDLEDLPFRPDIIHGQHHLAALSAVTALPDVPAIYHSHGAIWKDRVLKHPRVYRYLAMSRTYAYRIAVESNISPHDIEVFLNGTDMARFARVRKLPATPARALFYNRHHHADSQTVRAIREATSRCGLELDCIGYYFGRLTDEPENVLPLYDIVFASGLSAIEALACGCAVVVLGRTSCGEMVQPENFDRLRDANFSIATNSASPQPEKIEKELHRYSAEACASVTERLRNEADFRKLVARMVEIYDRVILQHQRQMPDLRAELLATSQYLREMTPIIKMTDEVLGENWVGA